MHVTRYHHRHVQEREKGQTLRLLAPSCGNQGRRHGAGVVSTNTVGERGDRRRGTMGTGCPGLSGGGSGRTNDLGLDEGGDHSASTQAERAMADDFQKGSDFAGVTGNGHKEA